MTFATIIQEEEKEADHERDNRVEEKCGQLQQQKQMKQRQHQKDHRPRPKQQELKPGAFIVIFTTSNQIFSVICNLDVGTASTLINASNAVGNSYSQVVFSLQCLYLLVSPGDLFGALKFETFVYVFSPIVKIVIVAVLILVLEGIVRVINCLKRAKNKAQTRRMDRGERNNEAPIDDTKDTTLTAIVAKDSIPKKPRKKGLTDRFFMRLGAVAVAIFILEQPAIIGKLCQYLTCVQLDPYVPKYYVKSRNNIECYTDEYYFFLTSQWSFQHSSFGHSLSLLSSSLCSIPNGANSLIQKV